MKKQVLATVSGEYYIYRDGDRVTISLEGIDEETENKFGGEWELSLRDAIEIFSGGVAVTHTSRWRAIRSVLTTWKRKDKL